MNILSIAPLAAGIIILFSSLAFMIGKKTTERKIFVMNKNIIHDIPTYFEHGRLKREVYNRYEQILVSNGKPSERSTSEILEPVLQKQNEFQKRSEKILSAKLKPVPLGITDNMSSIKPDFSQSRITYELLNPRMILVTVNQN
ncbi:MAG: hypothetical protein CVV24_05285 [Ignavibacteriae bacterium HGW-Ignavibacteriae-3]|nr:MAG: hypothetical protein CVV24_05285 [Ignavibacteriae bacterium HGW-Ignavibacteriae-3]